mgnify:CR=1 FL=1
MLLCIWCDIRTYILDRSNSTLMSCQSSLRSSFFPRGTEFRRDPNMVTMSLFCIYIFDKGVFCTNSFGMFYVCLLISADFPKSSSFGFKIEDETQKSQRLISIVYHKSYTTVYEE